jgi:hypothetical protein
MLVGCSSTHSDGRPTAPASTATTASASALAQRTMRLLESLLPKGKVSVQQGQGGSGRSVPPPSAELVFEQGGRAAKVTVALNRYSAPAPAMFLQCPDTAYHPYSRCTRTKLPGGARLVSDRSPKDDSKPSGAEVLTALVTYADGAQVSVSAAGPDEKQAVRNISLPLTHAQVTAIATSAEWKPVLSALPVPPASPRTGTSPRMTGQQISRVIKDLLPAGLHPGQQGGSEGFGHVVVDDGHGRSLVAANVQRWKPDDSAMTKLFRKADTLPDGTRISIRKGPASHGGKGTAEWSVDTLHKDGLRVVISALNAGAYPLPASRSEPALTIRQLQQIALDTAWEHASA